MAAISCGRKVLRNSMNMPRTNTSKFSVNKKPLNREVFNLIDTTFFYKQISNYMKNPRTNEYYWEERENDLKQVEYIRFFNSGKLTENSIEKSNEIFVLNRNTPIYSSMAYYNYDSKSDKIKIETFILAESTIPRIFKQTAKVYEDTLDISCDRGRSGSIYIKDKKIPKELLNLKPDW